MLSDSPIFTTLPASDLDRARAFYGEKLGLEPSQVLPQGDLEYKTGGIRFYVTQSAGKSSGEFTQASWAVGDIDAEASELRSRGGRVRGVRPARPRAHDGRRHHCRARARPRRLLQGQRGNLLGMIQFG